MKEINRFRRKELNRLLSKGTFLIQWKKEIGYEKKEIGYSLKGMSNTSLKVTIEKN